MKLEDQVTSLELSKKLKEIGVKQESLYTWVISPQDNEVEIHINYAGHADEYFSAYTVAELGEFLRKFPKQDLTPDNAGKYGKASAMAEDFVEKYTEANARAKMLIHLIDNQLINLK